MKAKVMKKFRDKRNGKIYKVGTVIEVTKDRFEEIRKTDESLVEAVAETEETGEKKTAKKAKAE